MSRKVFVFAISTLALAFFARIGWAQDCSAILANGTFEVTKGSSDVRDVRSFLNYLNQLQSSSEKTNQHSADSFGASYKGFGLEAAQENGFSSVREYLNYLQTLNTSDMAYEQHVRTFVQTASSVISEAWTKCMQIKGLHASVRNTSNQDEVVLIFQFNTPSTQPTATIVRLDYPSHVSCPGVTFPVKVSAAELPVRCVRKGSEQATILITADWALSSGKSVVEIPERIQPPKLISKAVGNLKARIGTIDLSVSVDAMKYSNGVTVGSFTYDRAGENFRGLIRCLKTPGPSLVTIAGPVTVYEQAPGKPKHWVVMDIRNPNGPTAGGIRVHGGDPAEAQAKCDTPGNDFPAALTSGQVTLTAQ